MGITKTIYIHIAGKELSVEAFFPAESFFDYETGKDSIFISQYKIKKIFDEESLEDVVLDANQYNILDTQIENYLEENEPYLIKQILSEENYD